MHEPSIRTNYEAALAHQTFIERVEADILAGRLVILEQRDGLGNRRVVPAQVLATPEAAALMVDWRLCHDPGREIERMNDAAKQVMACWN